MIGAGFASADVGDLRAVLVCAIVLAAVSVMSMPTSGEPPYPLRPGHRDRPSKCHSVHESGTEEAEIPSLGAGERIRTTDVPFTRSTALRAVCASCTDDTDQRIDGSRCAGIISRAVPRTVPRQRPMVFRMLLLYVTPPGELGCRPVTPASHLDAAQRGSDDGDGQDSDGSLA